MTEAAHGLDAKLALRRGALVLDVDIALPARGITALFGPSGAGKSTCLRAIAGLERDGVGRVSFGHDVWQDSSRRIFVPPHRRRLGYVFQEPSLFIHHSVAGNLDYGYRRARRPAHLDREGMIDRFGLRALLDRRVGTLSGGERQRVSMVRALLSDPALLLFDEPLSALDTTARADLLGCLERLHGTLRVPMIYVSHNIDEVVRLADHIVLLDDGHVVAQGSPQDTLTRLDLPPALGEALGSVVEGAVSGIDTHDQLIELAFAGGTLSLPYHGETIGQSMRCRIAARDVVLTRERQVSTSALNQVACRIVAMADAGVSSQCLVQLDASGAALLARITRRSWHALGLSAGDEVWAQVKAVALGA
ncbi:molybdenum ABC transporter ATP-binding protein [Dyella jiangningensis]|uniref:Molybdenum ABC transporter ATP-binding protein n=1 Tax=Dyella jiangningensis TaxID=1379159 RepID=A0A328P8Y2_9GAMM|nr:molybdenum ABC transporter ATP-binding protein [Dyella jiangningensis]RAO77731.1 molybdenum ABC transporter ATP-binding protein [Dyella jiangningensis]